MHGPERRTAQTAAGLFSAQVPVCEQPDFTGFTVTLLRVMQYSTVTMASFILSSKESVVNFENLCALNSCLFVYHGEDGLGQGQLLLFF